MIRAVVVMRGDEIWMMRCGLDRLGKYTIYNSHEIGYKWIHEYTQLNNRLFLMV
jgi:hypothetical protein